MTLPPRFDHPATPPSFGDREVSSVEPGPPRVATEQDAALVTRILVEAFHDDPMWGAWAFPEPATRRRHRDAVFRVLVEGALRYPWTWLTSRDAATAVWIPPGGDELSAAEEDRIDAVLRESLGARAGSVLQAFEVFAEARPTEPHYYLTLLGTDPAYAGRGLGRRLLSANLEQVDAEGMPAYLEASDDLVPLYERFGFRLLRRFVLSDGPAVNGLWRDPAPTEAGR